jgi:hypothetical protein
LLRRPRIIASTGPNTLFQPFFAASSVKAGFVEAGVCRTPARCKRRKPGSTKRSSNVRRRRRPSCRRRRYRRHGLLGIARRPRYSDPAPNTPPLLMSQPPSPRRASSAAEGGIPVSGLTTATGYLRLRPRRSEGDSKNCRSNDALHETA